MLRSGGWWSRATLLVLVALLALAGSACGPGDDAATVDRGSFSATVQERFAIDADRAACITDYVFEDYDPGEIEVLADDGVAALPQVRWGPYLDASAACITHDEPLPGLP